MSWPTVALKDVARIVGGATPKTSEPDLWDGPIFWATPKDLSGLQDAHISSTPRTITAKGLATCSSELLPPNSVLFSSRAPIGHVAINTVPMATNQGFKSMIPGPKLDPRFLYWWLDANRSNLQAMGVGATFKEVSKATVERIEIPLPPLEEQKRIAAILDQADALRRLRLRARALTRLNALGQAIFHEMFGDPIANGHLPLAELGTLADNLDGRRVPVKKSDRSEVQGKFPYYGASGIIDYVDDFLFEGTHLLVAEDGANLLSRSTPIAFIADGQFWVNNHAHVLAFNGKAELDFLRFFLQTLDLAPYITGSAQPKLNQKKLNQILVPVPPLADQRKFVTVLRKLEQQASEVQKSQIASETLFTSLQHRAFRGEL